jgi:flavin reductase (DIM6/NTAB) family NADH-FMN oxidoreductase RutF
MITQQAVEPDAAALRQAFSGFPCGVAAIAADVAGERSVLVASSFTVGVSLDPPLVMFAVQRTSTTWPTLAGASTLGVSILAEEHEHVTRQLAAKDKSARFDGVEVERSDSGALFLAGAPIRLECTIEDTHAAGDHDIVVLRVRDVASDFGHAPLVWHRSGFTRLTA